jgi:Ca2+-binding EF-hand superfamily protein
MNGMGEHGPDHAGAAITRQEFLDAHAKMFDQFDTNHDGKLDSAEIEAAHHHMMTTMNVDCAHMEHMPQMMKMDGDKVEVIDDHAGAGQHHGGHQMEFRLVHDGHDFGTMDKDHDGRISFEEFAAPLREAFDAMDKDHSGYLEKAEWPHGDGKGDGDPKIEIRREVHEDKQ